MGYTHYWGQAKKFTKPQWEKLRKAVVVLESMHRDEISLVGDIFDDADPIVANDDTIRFNGKGDLGHETFQLKRLGVLDFDFCKTAQKPYDTVVVAVLIYAAMLNSGFTWSSDGTDVDFVKAKVALIDALNNEVNYIKHSLDTTDIM